MNKDKIVLGEPITIDKVLTKKEFEEKINNWALENYGIKSNFIMKEEEKTLRTKISPVEKRIEKKEEIKSDYPAKTIIKKSYESMIIPYEQIQKDFIKKLDDIYTELTGSKQRVKNY